MKITTISVTVEQRINLGNFEGINPKAELTATLDEGDDVDECYKELYKLARKVWAKEALTEIRFYHSRAANKDDFSRSSQSTITELKKVVVS